MKSFWAKGGPEAGLTSLTFSNFLGAKGWRLGALLSRRLRP